MAVTLERAVPDTWRNDHAAYHELRHHEHPRLPPWEQNGHTLVRVPPMTRSRSPLRDVKHQEPFDANAAQHTDDIGRGQHSNGFLTPQNDVGWNTSRERVYIPPAPISAPPTKSPYESIKIPQGPKSAPQVPAFVNNRAHAPPQQPLHNEPDYKQAQHTTSIAEPQVKPAPAFPGTMASRQQEYPRSRGNLQNTKGADSPGFVKRFMSSFKNVFKREPVCEGDFERIEERHWSE
ncbi:uncharacterized protein MYCFIDRAFT_209812 [Pseudocercospora fijiensis CIRAD86]|uniref:Uncharacterized protein n=1 Tax=Pseudocercospora fijiensis (strain CIRAD86) TaxID=383855 RepID=N1QBE5_PSEFD|nr:uncharacterized protein MYCFIDRAFT_209812 [Pseudocercospora fijiensis CIRAD86]EME88458.1 hypothetical protein MYCFIDRAFT_209812 [Pseudocercospora fijiensis CIRAD86]